MEDTPLDATRVSQPEVPLQKRMTWQVLRPVHPSFDDCILGVPHVVVLFCSPNTLPLQLPQGRKRWKRQRVGRRVASHGMRAATGTDLPFPDEPTSPRTANAL
jgi:hypothetical protein